MILPLIMIAVCLVLGGGVFAYMKLSDRRKAKSKTEADRAQMAANEFVNVKDIRGKYLYTRNGYVLGYLRVMSISIDLFSRNEIRQLIRQLTAEMQSVDFPIRLIAVSRPVDISPLLSGLTNTLHNSEDVKQRELLKQEILEMSTFTLSGEMVERQFYIKVAVKVAEDCERELLGRLKILSNCFSGNGIQNEILEQQDIVRLCNLVNNPAYVHLEDADFDAAIPLLERVGAIV